jgi:hydrogenase nickel incorporation protein HypA/HybF
LHELPLVRSIIEKAAGHARLRNADRVSSISLVVGEGSGYVPESIRMYFDIAAAGTPCEGAALKIRRVKPLMKCSACGRLFERRPLSFDCPDCGSEGNPTETGRELYIEELEVEIPSDKGENQHEGNDTRARDGSDTDGERQAGGGHAPSV